MKTIRKSFLCSFESCFKKRIRELEDEIKREKEKSTNLSEELKRLKSDMVEKDDSIEELQKRVARLNAVSSV